MIRRVDKISDAVNNLKYCDGKIGNVVFDVNDFNNYGTSINDLFDTYLWLNKVIIMNVENIKVF